MKRILEGKIALVTGGGAGIGRAIAKRFVEEGAKVLITGRQEKPLCEASRSIGNDCNFKVCDISQKDQFEEVIHSMPHLDIIVNNAGICVYADPLSDDFFKKCSETTEIIRHDKSCY